MPIFFICMLIFCAWLWYERNKNERQIRKRSDAFWEREEEANHTRNKDISNLPYLHLEMDQIPGSNHADTNICELWNELLDLSKKPMLNLEEYSNTDLKLSYGVGNFNLLTSYDDNYNNFLVRLSNLGQCFSKINESSSAITCYKLAIDFGSRKAKDYISLAELYLKIDEPNQISVLISEVLENDSLERKEYILTQLRQILATYQ